MSHTSLLYPRSELQRVRQTIRVEKLQSFIPIAGGKPSTRLMTRAQSKIQPQTELTIFWNFNFTSIFFKHHTCSKYLYEYCFVSQHKCTWIVWVLYVSTKHIKILHNRPNHKTLGTQGESMILCVQVCPYPYLKCACHKHKCECMYVCMGPAHI